MNLQKKNIYNLAKIKDSLTEVQLVKQILITLLFVNRKEQY